MTYIKQLDSLRAIAVMLVIIRHWLPEKHALNFFKNGAIGVDIFFVLSGFLITTILFQYKHTENVSKSQIFKTFFARRTLRIFPIYYLTILAFVFASFFTETYIQNDIGYYLTYTSNFNFLLKGNWYGLLPHTWSLAVEEQFYLLWPCIILFTRKKYLLHAICIFVIIGIVSQIIFKELFLYRIITTSCFDAFGIGALLSWIITFKQEKLPLFYKMLKYLSILILLSLLTGYFIFEKAYWFVLPSRTIHSIFAIYTITFIYINRENDTAIFKYFLNWPVLVFMGKISYGIYLFHYFIPHFTLIFRNHVIRIHPLIKEIYTFPNVKLISDFTILIFLACLSFYLIEKPFLRLKANFKLN